MDSSNPKQSIRPIDGGGKLSVVPETTFQEPPVDEEIEVKEEVIKEEPREVIKEEEVEETICSISPGTEMKVENIKVEVEMGFVLKEEEPETMISKEEVEEAICPSTTIVPCEYWLCVSNLHVTILVLFSKEHTRLFLFS